MRWNAATGAIARCKATSIAYARKGRSVPAWRWTCGVKPTPKAVNKPSPHFIVHGLDKPGGFTTVSIIVGTVESAIRLHCFGDECLYFDGLGHIGPDKDGFSTLFRNEMDGLVS